MRTRTHLLLMAIPLAFIVSGCQAMFPGTSALAASSTTPLAVVGHRGMESTTTVTENSPAAVRAAIKLGVQGVEVDVRETKDGKQVVMHDPTLDRTTGCAGEIAQTTYAQVRACKLNTGEKVPNVAEVLAEVKRSSTATVWLHVKLKPTAAARKALMSTVDAAGLRKRTVVLMDENNDLDAWSKWSGIKRALIFNQADVNQGADESWGAGYDYAVPYQTPVTKTLVATARAAGSKVYAVEDNPLTLAEARTLRLDGIVANDVAAARK